MELLKLYISEPEVFQDKYEPNLPSGTYMWIDDNHLIYDKSMFNIFEVIDFDDLTEDMTIEISPTDK